MKQIDYKEKLIPEPILNEIKTKFYGVDFDEHIGKRLFFENSGGSLRLKNAVEAEARTALYPDCPLRGHATAKDLFKIQRRGIENFRALINANSGSVTTAYTASQLMFDMVRAVVENVAGDNVVTTSLEHPSSFDSCKYYAEKTGKELRVAKPNSSSGAVDLETIVALVDKQTCLLNVMYASNITGANMNIKAIVEAARKKNPDLFVIVDCVQYAPHGVIDVEELQIDGLNIAPYKFFGNRGFAIGYVSDRMSILPHHKLDAKDSNDWELGSPTPADFSSFNEVINYIVWLAEASGSDPSSTKREKIVDGMKVIKNQEEALLWYMINGVEDTLGLRSLEGVRIHFNEEDLSKRSLIVAISFDELSCSTAVEKFIEKGIVVYDRLASSPYSKRILDNFNLDGVVRVSPIHCYGLEDIKSFLMATADILDESVHAGK